MRNPFIMPLWLMLATALVTSNIVIFVGHSLWGCVAWLPWVVVLSFTISWERRHPV